MGSIYMVVRTFKVRDRDLKLYCDEKDNFFKEYIFIEDLAQFFGEPFFKPYAAEVTLEHSNDAFLKENPEGYQRWALKLEDVIPNLKKMILDPQQQLILDSFIKDFGRKIFLYKGAFMNKVTDKIAGCEITTFTCDDDTYITVFELAAALDTLNDDLGLSRFEEKLDARPEVKTVTSIDGKPVRAFLIEDVCNALSLEHSLAGGEFKSRLEKFISEFSEKILTKASPRVKRDETERIKKFVRDYAEMFSLSKLEAFKEIVQRKFIPPDDY